MTTSEMTPADFGAVCGNNNDGFGGNYSGNNYSGDAYDMESRMRREMNY